MSSFRRQFYKVPFFLCLYFVVFTTFHPKRQCSFNMNVTFYFQGIAMSPL